MTNKDMLDEQIECAIRERGAINYFKAMEAEEYHMETCAVPAASPAPVPAAASRRFSPMMWAVAASVALLLCAGGGIRFKDSRAVRSAYSEYVGSLDATSARSGSGKTLEEREKALEELKNSPEYADSAFKEEVDAEAQDLRFDEALDFMRRGRFIKAKKALKSIVAEDGIHADEARGLLEKF